MNAVFFPEHLNERAPSVVGALLTEQGDWVGIAEVAAALDAGESVDIRQAMPAELERAEACVQVYEAGVTLALNLQILYGNQGLDVADDAVFVLQHAIASVDFADVVLVDAAPPPLRQQEINPTEKLMSESLELVYFGQEHAERAPGVVGSIYSRTAKAWVSGLDVIESVQMRVPLFIRPATASEMKRIEALTVIYESGFQLTEKIGDLLEQDGPAAVANGQLDAMAKLGSIDAIGDLLDKSEQHEQMSTPSHPN